MGAAALVVLAAILFALGTSGAAQSVSDWATKPPVTRYCPLGHVLK